MTELARIADDLFPARDFFDDLMGRRFSGLQPTQQGVRHHSDEESLTISFDVPGIVKENLKATVQSRTLTIQAETETRNYFYRVNVGRGVDTETSEHNLENGVLTITFPFSKERQERNILG
jgi:HSP20 family molecular chaperone IbpA